MAWTDEEIAHSRMLLGVPEATTSEAVNKAYMQKSYALLRAGGSDDDKEQLKLARDALLDVLHLAEHRQAAADRAAASARREEQAMAKLVAAAEMDEEAAKEKDPGRWHP